MIVGSILILILSIILDGTIPIFTSNYLFSNFFFITIILIYPLFIKKKKLYLFLLVVSSIFYDILYTNILFLHTVVFFCIYLILDKNYKKMNFTLIIQYFFYYQFLLFSLFYTIDYTKDLFLILKMISSSLIIDFIYAGILYILFKDNYKLKKINYS